MIYSAFTAFADVPFGAFFAVLWSFLSTFPGIFILFLALVTFAYVLWLAFSADPAVYE